MTLIKRRFNSMAKGGSCYLSVTDAPKIKMPMMWPLCALISWTP